ncbi:uncharacterized protein LOC144701646 [Wolffia australiana]
MEKRGEGLGGKEKGPGNVGQSKVREGSGEVRIRAADMPARMQARAVRCAQEALVGMRRLESKRLAQTLKKEFDKEYGSAWHCIVGTSFGSYVTHSFGGFLYFSIEKVHILLFKTAVEPLDS